eukprot:SAG11_NODE_35284_length_267_cov_0.755952_1_plen_22_part_10
MLYNYACIIAVVDGSSTGTVEP